MTLSEVSIRRPVFAAMLVLALVVFGYISMGRLEMQIDPDMDYPMITVLTDAVRRSVGQQAATLKGEQRSGLRVHARTGLPCPVCGDTVREVSFADKSFQYCPTCQTGGKILADRRMSKLLK